MESEDHDDEYMYSSSDESCQYEVTCHRAGVKEESTLDIRRRRTKDLLISKDYCPHWCAADGVREIIQNWFDGLSTAFDVEPDEIEYKLTQQKEKNFESYIQIYNATLKDSNVKTSLGKIRYNPRNGILKVINERVVLHEEVLGRGFSTKRHRKGLIGKHGEGMLIGILRLVCDGKHTVNYYTGSETWHFFMGRIHGYKNRNLFVKTSKRTVKDPTSTTVTITNITDNTLRIDRYLKLYTKTSAIKGSECTSGYLISFHESASGFTNNRIYQMGIFVQNHRRLNHSIDLIECSTLNRDRKLIDENEHLLNSISNIWSTLISNEEHKNVKEREFTKRFIHISQKLTSTLECESLDKMSIVTAKVIIEYLRKTVSEDIFPYEKGNDIDKIDILTKLRRTPYPCSPGLYRLLSTVPNFKTFKEANRDVFINSASAQVQSPLASLVKKLVSSVSSDFNIYFRKIKRDDILIHENNIYISESKLEVDVMDSSSTVELLYLVEKEMFNSFGDDIRDEKSILIRKFYASQEYLQLIHPNIILNDSRPVGNATTSVDLNRGEDNNNKDTNDDGEHDNETGNSDHRDYDDTNNNKDEGPGIDGNDGGGEVNNSETNGDRFNDNSNEDDGARGGSSTCKLNNRATSNSDGGSLLRRRLHAGGEEERDNEDRGDKRSDGVKKNLTCARTSNNIMGYETFSLTLQSGTIKITYPSSKHLNVSIRQLDGLKQKIGDGISVSSFQVHFLGDPKLFVWHDATNDKVSLAVSCEFGGNNRGDDAERPLKIRRISSNNLNCGFDPGKVAFEEVDGYLGVEIIKIIVEKYVVDLLVPKQARSWGRVMPLDLGIATYSFIVSKTSNLEVLGECGLFIKDGDDEKTRVLISKSK